MVIDTVTGFCVLTQDATPQELQLGAASTGVITAAAAPSVCVSSFQVAPPGSNNAELPVSYFVDQTAASVCSEVNANNQRTFDNYQNAVQNWVMAGSVGPPPVVPTYQSFASAWGPNNMGPVPSSISNAAPGTPLPPGTFLTGGSPGGGPGGTLSIPTTPVSAPLPAPVVPAPAPAPTTSAGSGVTQKQISAAANAPPINMTGTTPTTAGSSTTSLPNPSSSGLSLAIIESWLQSSMIDSIPNWALLVAAGVGIYFLMKRH
jgi:hypothetical protein